MFRDFGIRAAGLVELGAVARERDPEFPYNRSIVALAKMTALYTGKHLVKDKERMSNWEQALTIEQRTCERDLCVCMEICSRLIVADAANDVHSGLMVYKRVMAIEKETPAEKEEREAAKAETKAKAKENVESATQERPGDAAEHLADGWVPRGVRPQHLRAYKLWHEQEESLETICAALRSKENPLKESTVM